MCFQSLSSLHLSFPFFIIISPNFLDVLVNCIQSTLILFPNIQKVLNIPEWQIQGVLCNFNRHVIFHTHLKTFPTLCTSKNNYLLLLFKVASRIKTSLLKDIFSNFNPLPIVIQFIQIQTLYFYLKI